MSIKAWWGTKRFVTKAEHELDLGYWRTSILNQNEHKGIL